MKVLTIMIKWIAKFFGYEIYPIGHLNEINSLYSNLVLEKNKVVNYEKYLKTFGLHRDYHSLIHKDKPINNERQVVHAADLKERSS